MLVDGCGCNGISGGMADVHVRGTLKLKCPVDLYDLSLYLLILETKVFSGLAPSEPPPDFEKF